MKPLEPWPRCLNCTYDLSVIQASRVIILLCKYTSCILLPATIRASIETRPLHRVLSFPTILAVSLPEDASAISDRHGHFVQPCKINDSRPSPASIGQGRVRGLQLLVIYALLIRHSSPVALPINLCPRQFLSHTCHLIASTRTTGPAVPAASDGQLDDFFSHANYSPAQRQPGNGPRLGRLTAADGEATAQSTFPGPGSEV